MRFIEFAEGTKHALKNSDVSDNPDVFRDCGVLIPNDKVVVDIDSLSKNQIQELLKRFEINTTTIWTDRGVHLWFQKTLSYHRPKNGVCALGFEIETKTKKNTPNGITIKRNGVMRTIENMDTYQEIPWYFVSLKEYPEVVGLSAGDGRNNRLFALKNKLDNHPDSFKIFQFVNQILFDEPLDDKELELVTRDTSSSKGDLKQFDVATEIMNQYKCVDYQGQLWWWNGSEYIKDKDGKKMKEVVFDRSYGESTAYVDEVIKQIMYRCKKPEGSSFPIRFRNGVLTEDKFVNITDYDEFTPYFINIDYLPDAEPVEDVDKFIDALASGEEEYKLLLMECMGYPLVTDPEMVRDLGKFFILRGNGANGKGTMLQIMRRIYNPRNCGTLSIAEMCDERYNVTLVGKLVNLGDDVQPTPINHNQMKMLKNISTADTISMRRLYQQSEDVTVTAKLFFAVNSDIKTFEKGYALKRRIMWLPMFNTVEKKDPKFISKMTSDKALKYWIKLIMEGYFRLIEQGHFTASKKVEEYNEQYHRHNNHMEDFVKDIDIEHHIISRTPREVKEYYENEYNDDKEEKAYKSKLLNEVLADMNIGLGVKKIDGVSRRVYMRQSDTDQELFGIS